MFNDDDGISFIHQTVKDLKQKIDIVEMQTGRRLVQNKHRLSGPTLAQLPRKLDPLGFSP